MYRTDRNNYHQKPKPSAIYTPPEVSQFIFDLLRDKIPNNKTIFDPCCGKGSLLKPWKEAGWLTLGNDSDSSLPKDDLVNRHGVYYEIDFLRNWKKSIAPSNYLILCNPPFNGYGNKLGSEVWLDKIIELFGKDTPVVLFAPMGFRLNSKKNGKRWNKFANHEYPPISSIISLPLDIFPEVEFHSEILIFNLQDLKSHYFFNPTSKIEQRTPI